MSNLTTAFKGSRSKSGCRTCRARKVRCDERHERQPGPCLNCEKLGLPCSKSTPSSEQNPPPNFVGTTSLKRKRTFRSCTACRATKTRCSGDRPVCIRCREKSLRCEYDDSSEPVWRQQLNLSNVEREQTEGADATDSSLRPEQDGSGSPLAATGIDRPVDRDLQDNGSWLRSWSLPGNERIRMLVECYFKHIHPLRCFGFLHKPSFMQRLDAVDTQSREGDALLLIVCSLGALLYAVEIKATESSTAILAAGSQWAKRAQQLILAQLGTISVENLMAAILLHEYELRMANFGNAFMLSGLTARMAQALQINLEHSTDILCQDTESGPGASTKESRRRLMWCCYVTDSLVGSGVDQLTLLKEADIKIQLPCTERNFLYQAPCITEVLEPGRFLTFIGPESLPSYPQDNMGIRACYLRHTSIRRKVLKYIKHLDVAKMPWQADSEFVQLDALSRAWYDSLPESLQFTPNGIYTRAETNQLGALCGLHIMYHMNMIDLYRIGAPALYKLRNAFTFPPDQRPFVTRLQDELYGHARKLATITAEALRHGPHALADSWTPTVAYESCRVMLFYLTQLIDPGAERSRSLMNETIPLVRNNVRALKTMRSMYAVADLLSNAAEKMLEKIGVGPDAALSGQNIVPDEPYPTNDTDGTEPSAPGTPLLETAPDYVLNPLSIYRMARKTIAEKHAPEKQPVANSITNTAVRQPLQRRATLQHVPYDVNNAIPVSNTVNSYGMDQAGFDDLLSIFTSDPSGWTWQPSDTALGSQMESSGLPPWESTYSEQQLDAWIPIFSQTHHFGY